MGECGGGVWGLSPKLKQTFFVFLEKDPPKSEFAWNYGKSSDKQFFENGTDLYIEKLSDKHAFTPLTFLPTQASIIRSQSHKPEDAGPLHANVAYQLGKIAKTSRCNAIMKTLCSRTGPLIKEPIGDSPASKSRNYAMKLRFKLNPRAH